MTDAMMSLRGLLEKAPEAGLLRAKIGFSAQCLMELEVDLVVRRSAARGVCRRERETSAARTGRPQGRPVPHSQALRAHIGGKYRLPNV